MVRFEGLVGAWLRVNFETIDWSIFFKTGWSIDYSKSIPKSPPLHHITPHDPNNNKTCFVHPWSPEGFKYYWTTKDLMCAKCVFLHIKDKALELYMCFLDLSLPQRLFSRQCSHPRTNSLNMFAVYNSQSSVYNERSISYKYMQEKELSV